MARISLAVFLKRDVMLTTAAIVLAVGLIVLVATVSGKTLARAAGATKVTGEIAGYVVASILLACGVIAGCIALLYYGDDDLVSPYDRYLVGTGYALALLALLNFTALAGFQLSGQLSGILDVDFSKPGSNDSLQRTAFLALLPGLAVLGALFFHANSLRKKRDSLGDTAAELVATKSEKITTKNIATPQTAAAIAATTSQGLKAEGMDTVAAAGSPSAAAESLAAASPSVIEATTTAKLKADPSVKEEPFSQARFWAGLWFRIGEAILFALIFFLIAKAPNLKSISGAALLLASLIVGMFVKSGETLIAGIADRVFNAVQALVKP